MTDNSSWKLGRSSALALVLTALSTPVALAQAGAAASNSDEIVVTGSHLGRTSFNSPTPVNVIGEARMKDLAIPNVADALNQIPSFRAISTPASNFFRVSGNIAARSMDLRGLGSTRTLVLVDGHRVVPSGDNGAVDLNLIPSSLVSRAEVVTGGASAAYGADAVSGVVNLILDTKFSGFKADINSGVSGHGDDVNYFASFAGGADFAGGRGHVVAGMEWNHDEGINRCDNRDFCHKYTNYIANPGYVTGTGSTNGLPANLVLDNVLFVYNKTGILISANRPNPANPTATQTLAQQVLSSPKLPAALQGKGFDNNGNLTNFQFGNYLSGVFMQGGDPSVDAIYGLGDQPLLTQNEHASALAHFDYDLTSNITASAEVMYSHVLGGKVRGSTSTESPVNLIINDTANPLNNNPFVNPSVRAAILAADPTITSINVNVAKVETGSNAVGTSRNDTFRALAGLKGDLGFKDWAWDTSYEFGDTDGLTKIRQTRLKTWQTEGPQAVTPPPGYTGTIYTTPSGAPVICKSSVTLPGNGCVPINFLGLNSVTPAMMARYYRDEFQTRSIKQYAFSGNVRGSLFDLWAGPVSGAVGGEWRRDTAEGITDDLTPLGVFISPQATALPKVAREVKEGYVETSVPLLKDQPFAKSLTVDATGRYTEYSTSGAARTWKLGLVYEPNDQLLFRFTKSSDIRAPTAAELNPNTVQVLLPLADPFGGGTHNVNTVTGGNPNLKLEEGRTKTAGVVYKPSFIPNLRISTDYYDISVGQAIDTLSSAAILSACSQQNLLCNLITFSGAFKASPTTTVLSTFQNLSTLHAEGAELVADYNIDALGGNFAFQVNANYIMDLRTVGATGLVTRLDGVTGNSGSVTNIQGVPQYKLDSVVTYTRDNWSVTAHGRYIPEGILDPTKIGPDDPRYDINLPNSQNINRVDSRAYLDLSGSYTPTAQLLGGKMQLYGSISNVFDTEEPAQLRLIGNPLQFDPIGRAFRLGVRANW